MNLKERLEQCENQNERYGSAVYDPDSYPKWARALEEGYDESMEDLRLATDLLVRARASIRWMLKHGGNCNDESIESDLAKQLKRWGF